MRISAPPWKIENNLKKRSMEIIKHTTGKDRGQISVSNTIATMDVGEVWTVSEGVVVKEYVRNACSRYGRQDGKIYKVSAPKQQRGIITITRIK